MRASSLDRRRVGDSPWEPEEDTRHQDCHKPRQGGRRQKAHLRTERTSGRRLYVPRGGGGGGREGHSQAQLCSIRGLSTSGHCVGLPQVCVCGRGASCVHPKQGSGRISHQPPGGVGLGLAVLKPQPSVAPPGLDAEASGLGNCSGSTAHSAALAPPSGRRDQPWLPGTNHLAPQRLVGTHTLATCL